MRNFFIKLIGMSLAVLAVGSIMPGIYVRNFGAALVAALILGLVNAFIRPLLIILTLPLTIVTLGFFILILNAILFLMVGWLVGGFEVAGLGSAIIGSLLVSFISWLINILLDKK